jgi:hypothetical protein
MNMCVRMFVLSKRFFNIYRIQDKFSISKLAEVNVMYFLLQWKGYAIIDNRYPKMNLFTLVI